MLIRTWVVFKSVSEFDTEFESFYEYPAGIYIHLKENLLLVLL